MRVKVISGDVRGKDGEYKRRVERARAPRGSSPWGGDKADSPDVGYSPNGTQMRMVIYTVDECENENDSEGPTAYRLLHNWQLSLMVSCMIGGTATRAMKIAMTAKYTGVYLMICSRSS